MDYFIFILHIHIFVSATNSFLQVNTYENFCITSNEGVKKKWFWAYETIRKLFFWGLSVPTFFATPSWNIFSQVYKIRFIHKPIFSNKKGNSTKVGYLPNQVPFLLRSHPIFSLYLRSAPFCAPQINSTTKHT